MKIYIKKIIKTSRIDIFEKRGVYTFLNPVSYLQLRKTNLLDGFTGVFCDGGVLVKFINFFYREKLERFSFDMTSLAPMVFQYAVKNHKSIYIIGSDELSIDKAKKVIEGSYPGIFIIGHRHGYFKNEEELISVANGIMKQNVDIVIAGMGCGLQEKFLLELKSQGFVKLAFTCGGFFHQLSMSGNAYYPTWINRFNLRFVYRMVKEKHTRLRYIRAGILFPILFIYDLISG